MTELEPYLPRDVEFQRIAAYEGWRLKLYGLATGAEPVSGELVETGLNGILPHLPRPALAENRYGVGFVIIHRGALRNWFSLAWWEYDDILFHKLCSSPLDNAGEISAEESAAIACVHELKIIAFENEAWIRTALSSGGGAGFERYLDDTFASARDPG